mgnify:CR=1 FL=1
MPNFLGPVPEQWKADLKTKIEQYANENWNRKRLNARIEKIVDWNRYYGNGLLKIRCEELGCYQGGVKPADRVRYIKDIRSVFEENKIGWAYWSYNETFSVMTSDRTPFGPATPQIQDNSILGALLPEKSQESSAYRKMAE